MKSPRFINQQSGGALLVVLALATVLAFLVLGTLVFSAFDQSVIASTIARQKADRIGDFAVQEAAEKLARIPIDRHWAAAPGRLEIWSGSDWENVELYSEGTNPEEVVNVNARLAGGENYVIVNPDSSFPTAPVMEVHWVYVTEDGRRLSEPAEGVIGRYAYWVDVENARININTAGLGMVDTANHFFHEIMEERRISEGFNADGLNAEQYRTRVWEQNPWMFDSVVKDDLELDFSFHSLTPQIARTRTIQNLTAHPSSLNLSVLDGVTEQDSLNTFRYAGSYFLRVDALNAQNSQQQFVNPMWSPIGTLVEPDLGIRFFASPADWGIAVGEAVAEQNKGYITTLGRSPEINPWGLPKIAFSGGIAQGHSNNQLTEEWVRGAPRSMAAENLRDVNDTRSVQLPALDRNESGRGSFRDLFNRVGVSDSGPFDAVERMRLTSTLRNTLSQPPPGYSRSLGGKFGPGETAQIVEDLIVLAETQLEIGRGVPARNLLDYREIYPPPPSSNPAPPRLEPQPDYTLLVSSGRTFPRIDGDTHRRHGTVGPVLLSEIEAQATASQTSPNQLHPGPYPVAYRIRHGNNSEGVFMLRAENPGDGWFAVRFLGEAFLAQHWGMPLPFNLRQVDGLGGQPKLEYFFSAVDVILEVTSIIGDPNYPALPPSRRLTLRNDHFIAQNPTINGGDARMFAPVSSGSLALWPSNFDPSVDNRHDTRYLRMTGNQSTLIGPFDPNATVSFRLLVRFSTSTFFPWFIAQTHATAGQPHTVLATYPGIVANFDLGTMSDGVDPNDLSQEGLFEFAFEDFGVGQIEYVNYEADDPRVTRRVTDWQVDSGLFAGSMDRANNFFTGDAASGGSDASDVSTPPTLFKNARGWLRNVIRTGHFRPMAFTGERQFASRILGMPGVGYLSGVSTGIDSGVPWRTMKFFANDENPPDWLVWNLFFVPFDRSIANQTDGKMNINATLYPFGIQRTKPLEALLLGRPGLQGQNPETLARRIASQQFAPGFGSGISIGPPSRGGGPPLYVYPGQICNVNGIASNFVLGEYSREALPRDLGEIVTTQSTDFRVFLVAEAGSFSNGAFRPAATRHMEVTLSRVPDTGGFVTNMPNPAQVGRGRPFGRQEGVSQGGTLRPAYPFFIYLRGDYETNRENATPRNANDPAFRAMYGNSTYGLDDTPGTADDWLIPHRIDFHRKRIIQ